MNTGLEWFQWVIIGLLVVLPILYELSNTFKYYAKFSLYYLAVNVISIITIPYAALRPKNPENHCFAAWQIRNLKKLFGISIEVRGKENLETETSYIMVINHQSSLDLLGIMEIWPKRCASLAKRELMYAGPFGFVAWLCGTVFIDRLNHEKAIGTMQQTASHIRDNKVSVMVFPEGTRNHEGSMLPFKKGAFHLAVESQVPVVPVVMSSYSDFYSKREKRFTTGKFIVTCLPKVPTEGLTSDDVPDLMERVRTVMLDVFNQTSLETTQAKLSNH